MTTVTSKWRNHTKSQPCPVCGNPDRCKFTDDGAHRCFRTRGEIAGGRLMKTCKDGTGIYRIANESSPARAPDPVLPHSRKKQGKMKNDVSPTDWSSEALRLTNALAPERLNELAQDLGVSAASLKEIGVGWAEHADLKRLNAFGEGWASNFPEFAFSFPECDAEGKVIGLCFRAMDGRKGAAKGGHRGLTIPANLKSMPGPRLIVEGPSDVAACLTMGIPAVGRPSNTGGVDHLVGLLSDEGAIVLGENDSRLVDGGKLSWPGREGAQAISRGLASRWNKSVRMTMPPRGAKDVREWLNARQINLNDPDACASAGRELMHELLAAVEIVEPAPPDLTFRLERHPKRATVAVHAVVDGKTVAIDHFKLTSNKRRSEFVHIVADKEQRLKPEDIERKLFEAAIEPEPAKPKDDAPQTREALLAKRDEEGERLLAAMSEEAIRQAEDALAKPNLINLILADLASLGIVGEQVLALSIYCVGTSRLLADPDHPLSAIVQGLSATGKSFVIDRVASVFPGEALLRATDLTPQSLFYLPNGRLINCWVVAGERSRKPDDERAEATRALREMQSAGRLSKATPIKINGRLETVVIEQEGPIAFIESTTLTSIFDEDANRCLLLGTDESPDQTARIMAAAAARSQSAPLDPSSIIARHHAIQRLLRRVRVRIPFADRLAAAMPSERPEARRAFTHALDTIKVVALLHQRQRVQGELIHGDCIDATIDDYQIARRLLVGPLGRALGGALPDAVANLARRLSQRFGSAEFTTTQAVSDDSILKSPSKMGEYLRSLERAGVAVLVTEGKGNKPHTWQILGDPPEAGAKWLPEGDALKDQT